MADYYTQFSFMLPVTEGMLGKAQEWLDAQREVAERMCMEDDVEYWEIYGDVRLEMDEEESGIWVYSSDTGNVEAAMRITEEYLRWMEMDGGVLITWAQTCSKPRIHSFVGGGVVVTRNGIASETWSGHAEQIAAENAVEVLNPL